MNTFTSKGKKSLAKTNKTNTNHIKTIFKSFKICIYLIYQFQFCPIQGQVTFLSLQAVA